MNWNDINMNPGTVGTKPCTDLENLLPADSSPQNPWSEHIRVEWTNGDSEAPILELIVIVHDPPHNTREPRATSPNKHLAPDGCQSKLNICCIFNQ